MSSPNPIAFRILTCCSLLLAGCNRESPPPAPTSRVASPSTSAVAAAALPSASSVAAPGALLTVGAEVPDVAAPAQDGKLVNLRALKGKPVIVYFYPKDDTTGCTIEAKGIRDQYAELSRRAVVLGVSEDSLDSHQAFAAKYELPFQLLDDTNHALATAFGVPLSAGKAKRVTFVIDASGKVAKVFPNVNPDGHALELIEALKALG
ncbi:MAG TPA: peroxiredoxin [Polyangiaceae bacterium]|nr:peroxiredoxin [Polyangiaceae bacterium]